MFQAREVVAFDPVAGKSFACFTSTSKDPAGAESRPWPDFVRNQREGSDSAKPALTTDLCQR